MPIFKGVILEHRTLQGASRAQGSRVDSGEKDLSWVDVNTSIVQRYTRFNFCGFAIIFTIVAPGIGRRGIR